MKNYFLSIALLFVGVTLFAQSISFSSTDLNNHEITDEIFSAVDVTVVNVWATYCSPCIREMPDLADYWNRVRCTVYRQCERYCTRKNNSPKRWCNF